MTQSATAMAQFLNILQIGSCYLIIIGGTILIGWIGWKLIQSLFDAILSQPGDPQ